jgi:N-glycosylase/DNA lyase
VDPERPGVLTLSASPAIDLEATLDGGQAFRWWREGESYRGVVGRRAYRVSGRSPAGAPATTEASEMVVEAVDDWPLTPRDEAMLRRYLGLDYDFAAFAARFAGDPCIGPAITGWPGLRVLRQDRWECLVAFICSSTSNIPRIKQNVNAIAVAYGDRVGPGPHDFVFPSAPRLAEVGEAPLRELGLGFRARFVARAAQAIASGQPDLEAVAAMSYEQALESLMRLYGVGMKVADCALAFAFDKPQAFPVDRWVKRALEEWYRIPEKLSMERTAAWARARFGPDAVYVNQYLFHRQRLTARGVSRV